MDKQKQILEIAEVIAKYISSRDFEVKFIINPKSKAFPFSHTAGVAEELYNAGYRKIPENAVLLTREEHIQMLKDLAESNEITYKTAYERGCKETAEKFAEKLKSMVYQSTDWSHGEHPMVVEVDYIDEVLEEIIGEGE